MLLLYRMTIAGMVPLWDRLFSPQKVRVFIELFIEHDDFIPTVL
jgi:hypothetical protein